MNTELLNQIYSKYSKQDVHKWRADLIGSVQANVIDGIEFPSFPDPDLQRHLQGSSHEIAVRGALDFRHYCVGVFNRYGQSLTSESTLIDFGSGWGRIARAFMRDIPASNIFAVEPFDFIVDARRNNPFISFIKSNPRPPLLFCDGFASHLVTYSTFTHFNEDYFQSWVAEFARVIQPGGIAILTTLGVQFLSSLKQAAADLREGREIHFWIKLILNRMNVASINSLIDRAKEGEFVWLPSSHVERSEFAECFVTDTYFKRHFSRQFEVIDYSDNGELAQDCIALRRIR